MVQGETGISERQALEAFLLDNPELEQLETLLGEFNLFEAIGAVRQELRHSDFLAFLLDPHESHGLGDAFPRDLLLETLRRAEVEELPLAPLEIALADLFEPRIPCPIS